LSPVDFAATQHPRLRSRQHEIVIQLYGVGSHKPACNNLRKWWGSASSPKILEVVELTLVYDLDRFIAAQAPVMETVRSELMAGAKRTHWMWFIFPQLAELGRSRTAKFYGIASLDEAKTYLAHPVLGPRLSDCTALVNRVNRLSAYEVFGSPDDLKFRSCVTLFSRADSSQTAFNDALNRFFDGQPDPKTLELI
jgi:uncharacterized protein (DUF1810 family)